MSAFVSIRWYFCASLLTAVLASLLFVPGLPGEFVFDDIPNIVGNYIIHVERLDLDTLLTVAFSPQISGFMRVLPTVSFAVDSWRGDGPDPALFKTTNILIHGLTTLALTWFFRSLLLVAGTTAVRTRWIAPVLALSWAAHPLQVSSVLYAVQRIQTMGTFFLVLALWMYLSARKAQIEGRPGRNLILGAIISWLAAMGCKEDSVLLPAYTLALELTVLRFAAAEPKLARLLRRGYLLAASVGAAIYLFAIIPHYWHWDAYQGRDFNTYERLLTQGRVLCMYLGQIVVPLPRHMSFYYDWLTPSRGLMQPWTTLPAIGIVIALLTVAWRSRNRQPLLAFGLLLFFSAHFITSNVIGLELAFEHRNNLALVGAVLAIGSVAISVSTRLRIVPRAQVAICTVLLVALASTTAVRSHIWSSNLSLAKSVTSHTPTSARGWNLMCLSHLLAGGGAIPQNPYLDDAIAACSKGAENAPYALGSLSRLIIYKTLRGDVTPSDWDRLRERLQFVTLGQDNRLAVLMLAHNVRIGVELDGTELVRTLAILNQRVTLQPSESIWIGRFLMADLKEPDAAVPYFFQAIKATAQSRQLRHQLADELRASGRPDLAEQVESSFGEEGSAAAATVHHAGEIP